MANFINYIIESSVQPTKTNVLWIKNGVPYYFNKKWKPLLGVGSGGGGSSEEIKSPIIFGEGKNSAILQYTNSNALGENSVSLGSNTITNNIGEAAFGMYNKSILSTDPSKASLFSIGNGTSNVLKNAFEIKYNGDVYIENIDTSIQEYLKQLTLADSKLSSDLNLIINTTISNLRSEISQIETDLNGKIETNTSLITQTAFEITQEVSNLEVKYDDEFANTKESISKISQKADTIELEVEEVKTTTNGLSTRIEENTASIELNKRNITSKVSRSEFNSATEEINKQYTEVVQTVDNITQTVKAQDGRLTQVETTVDGLTVKTGTLEADIESLKKQSDGSIDTHFGTVAPTLDNEPAVNWVTDEEKIDHTGDIYYNNNTGEAYRFSYDPTSNTYFWVELTDSALTDALSKISKLEEAIDGKVTIFYTEPTNYKYGDLWFVHKDYNSYKEGSIVTSTNIGKDVFKESFTESDWEVKTNYTTIDDLEDKATEINDYIEGAFKDNVLTEAELSNIKELKASFELAQAELEESYNILYISSVATQENKNLLSSAFNALKTAYNALIDALDNLTAGNVDEYRTAYSEYLEALKNYSKIASEFTESIQSELLKANQYISDIASDNIVTPIEKKQLFEIWRQILEEFETNKGIAINYKIIDSEGNQRTDIYTSNDYYLVYKFYKDAYTNLIDKFDVFDLDNLNITTTLPNGYSISAINAALDIYYSALKEFSKLISKITIEITDAHDKALALANSWQEHLDPKDAISVIGKGVILSTVIGVQSEGVLEAVLNASDDLPQAIDSIHGKIIFAGGIGGSENWNDATTLIYEDGYVHFKYGKIDESVQLGSAFLKAVAQSSEIDVLSYPQNGVNVPLLQINKDNTGKIISISSLYDFYVNGNLVAYGDVATSGAGQDTPGSGSSVIGGIMVNGMPYTDDDGDGFITLPDYPKKLSALENDLNLGSFAYKNALAVSDIPDLSGKYLPKTGGTISGSGSGILTINSTSGNPLISFQANGTSVGFLGVDTDASPCYVDPINYGKYILIHSGNVGDYNAGSADVIAKTYKNESINYRLESRVRMISLTASNSVDLGAPKQYVSGLSVISDYVGWQLVSGASEWDNTDFYIRKLTDNGKYLAWKTIAFTDSNVASATKLQTARTIWGQPFDGTRNVDGSLAITNGTLTLTKGQMLRFHNAADNTHIEAISFRGDSFHIGYGNIGLYDTYMQGNNIVFRPGTGKEAMRINNSGNVGIGTTDPQYKLDVTGTGRFTGKVSASGGIDIPNGQQLAFLDASGNRHTIAWDSASNGILIDGNLIVLGELATGLPMQEIPSIPEIGV